MVTKGELRKKCKAAGLSQTGNCSDLEGRLKSHKNRGKPEVDKDLTCDAILLTKAMIGNENSMKRSASQAFKDTLDEKNMEVCNVMGELYVGNPAGLGLAGVPQRLHILEAQIAALTQSNAALVRNNSTLTDYVSILRLAGPDYKRVRNRFLTVYKRDGLKEVLTPSDKQVIQRGNVTAHSGDAAIHALLYDGIEGRQNTYLFKALYGLHPSDVKYITHDKTIELLNLHACIKAGDNQVGRDEFYRKFLVFIEAYQRSDPSVNYLAEGLANETCVAYRSILQCRECEGLSAG
ncbi:hypothetical protein B9Z19DRAFT_1074567 [Tuber borchii]|uniref:SAP domain-containing protein n=1 Tax=Tuber borchii TaxID=42251 RepID=A0A2T7A490_TUBBO|nr:hypothetical protein B9Z19DRAFT_1074567 [Tuber borchii]